MSRDQMIREIGRLYLDDVIAELCGSPLLEDAATYANEWTDWVLSQDEDARWGSWRDCHREFSLSLCATWGVTP